MKRYIIFASLILSLGFQSCEKFLDTLPDNRLTINSDEGVRKLLINAYPKKNVIYATELMSDNTCDLVENKSFSSLESEQLFYWQDPTYEFYDSPKLFWSNSYKAVTVANEALATLNKIENTENKDALRAEALLCRAYNMFSLINLYSHSYNPQYADTDMGIPYLTEVITNIEYRAKRPSLKDNYEQIEKDLQEALPNIRDQIYEHPKFHFNKKAALAFATRFYLYYQKWDKVIEYSSEVLGDNPKSIIRDWDAYTRLSRTTDARLIEYSGVNNRANLMLASQNTLVARSVGFDNPKRFTHPNYLAKKETCLAPGAWGVTDRKLKSDPIDLISPFNKNYIQKYPTQWEITDPVAHTGIPHSTIPLFTSDEVLLSRAEAYIHLGMYDKALDDMNIWLQNSMNNVDPLTQDKIVEWNKNTKYCRANNLTPRNKFDADFPIKDRLQNDYLQVMLQMRRIETLHQGLRWYDIKRYGIILQRYRLSLEGDLFPTDHVLKARDNRHALQLPQDVLATGMQQNIR